MDSTAAITKRIASSNYPPEVKQALVAMFNAELRESNLKGVSRANYLRELESRSQSWVQTSQPDEGQK
jgi:hypothetical protein